MANAALATLNGSNLAKMGEATAEVLVKVLATGELNKLTETQKLAYYGEVCKTTGLNPYTRPFEFIILNGKLTLYARKDATDQLRSLHNVSVRLVETKRIDDCYLVVAEASTPNGRVDSSTGAVSIAGLKGEAMANALMKAETKAKRRATLSICGLGMLDETELETIRNVEHPGRVSRPTQHSTDRVIQGEVIEDLPQPDATNTKAYGLLVAAAKRRFTSPEAFTAWVATEAPGKTPDNVTEDDCKALYEKLATEILAAKAKAEAEAAAAAVTPPPSEDRAAAKKAWYAALTKRLDEHTALWWGAREMGFVAGDDTLSTTPVQAIVAATQALSTFDEHALALIMDDHRNEMTGVAS